MTSLGDNTRSIKIHASSVLSSSELHKNLNKETFYVKNYSFNDTLTVTLVLFKPFCVVCLLLQIHLTADVFIEESALNLHRKFDRDRSVLNS